MISVVILEHPFQLVKVAHNLRFHLFELGDDFERRVVLNRFVDDFLVSIQREVVVVLFNLRTVNEERLAGSVVLTARVKVGPLLENVWDVALVHFVTLVVKAQTVGLHVVEPHLIGGVALREEQNSCRHTCIGLEHTRWQ